MFCSTVLEKPNPGSTTVASGRDSGRRGTVQRFAQLRYDPADDVAAVVGMGIRGDLEN